MAKPYEILSKYYEDIINDNTYQEFLNLILKKVKENSPTKKGFDCACGSGLFTRKLKREGFSVIGVDISEEMLKEAKSKSISEKIHIDYLKQDMKNLKSFEKVGFISVVNDGINYLSNKDLIKAFKSFNKCLVKGGCLIFDISSKYKLEKVLNGNVFCDNNDKLSYMWFNSFIKDKNAINLTLTFFENQGNSYKRFDEEQLQYIHAVEDIKNALNDCGFKVVDITDEYGFDIKENSQKNIFTAIKE